ncbi:hypothetical protein VTK73DRAFT_860 [Phialemonium thermophilum]|uniref:Uncharacterized protein n=1 Tax=Phialemonium thermophilum TaxID=223376 RepID=A0ABR3VU65_9PEZI
MVSTDVHSSPSGIMVSPAPPPGSDDGKGKNGGCMKCGLLLTAQGPVHARPSDHLAARVDDVPPPGAERRVGPARAVLAGWRRRGRSRIPGGRSAGAASELGRRSPTQQRECYWEPLHDNAREDACRVTDDACRGTEDVPRLSTELPVVLTACLYLLYAPTSQPSPATSCAS